MGSTRVVPYAVNGGLPAYPITFADTPAVDPFGRLRMSEQVLLLDLKRVGGTPDNLATSLATGVGSLTGPDFGYQINRSSTFLGLQTGGVGKTTRQTRARGIYQPGKGLLLDQTFIGYDMQAGAIDRAGYFDDNDGFFLRRHLGGAEFVLRSSASGVVVEEVYPQSEWNVDRLDGNGMSGQLLDLTAGSILIADLQWLGVGRVRAGFNIDGKLVECLHINNANNRKVVYVKNPNLPVRWETEATQSLATPHKFEAICCSLNSEGGYEVTGVTTSADSVPADTPDAGKAIASGATAELMSIRMQNGENSAAQFADFATGFIRELRVINTTNGPFRWRLVLNPATTVGGTWLQDIPGSIMERNITRTVTPNTGFVLDSGFVASSLNSVEADSRPVLTMGKSLAGVSDVISLQITNINNQSETFFGTMTWREVY